MRHYRIQEKGKSFGYGDLQIWPFLGGIGIGKMIEKEGNKYTRFKTGVGAFWYATYDYCKDLENAKHKFGVIGTFPITNILGGNYQPL